MDWSTVIRQEGTTSSILRFTKPLCGKSDVGWLNTSAGRSISTGSRRRASPRDLVNVLRPESYITRCRFLAKFAVK